MTNKDKFYIIYKKFAKPIADMKTMYDNSTLTIAAGIVNAKSIKSVSKPTRCIKRTIR